MPKANTLTKSLHTVTAVTNVARLIRDTGENQCPTAEFLTSEALVALGYAEYDSIRRLTDAARTDETVLRCIQGVAKMLAKGRE